MTRRKPKRKPLCVCGHRHERHGEVPWVEPATGCCARTRVRTVVRPGYIIEHVCPCRRYRARK